MGFVSWPVKVGGGLFERFMETGAPSLTSMDSKLHCNTSLVSRPTSKIDRVDVRRCACRAVDSREDVQREDSSRSDRAALTGSSCPCPY